MYLLSSQKSNHYGTYFTPFLVFSLVNQSNQLAELNKVYLSRNYFPYRVTEWFVICRWWQAYAQNLSNGVRLTKMFMSKLCILYFLWRGIHADVTVHNISQILRMFADVCYEICQVSQIAKFMGPTWVLSAPDRPHVGPMNLAIRVKLIPSQWDLNLGILSGPECISASVRLSIMITRAWLHWTR